MSEEIGQHQGTKKKMQQSALRTSMFSHKTKSSRRMHNINGHHSWNFGLAKAKHE
jgi:hypothetical protein